MRPTLEVADIFRRHGEAFRRSHGAHLGRIERRVMAAIELCRTPALGGHVEQCGDCGLVRCAYNSCRNRHCPKCQGLARAEWLEARQAELLPVPYYHVVFTLPPPVAEIAFQNKRAVYAILFHAAAEAMRDIAAEPRHLGAEIGAVAVLHTWGQTLQHHPHLHCIVPGGGLSPDQTRWVACRPGFFLPVRVLSRRFRTLFLARLQAAFVAGELRFSGTLAALAAPNAFAERLDTLRAVEWVVYAKRPFAGPEQVLAYLGRYTHRVALANSRLTRLADGQVDFTWKDYRSRQDQGADARCRRIHSAVPSPRRAERVPPHPPCRLPRERPSHRKAGAVPCFARSPDARATAGGELPRAHPPADWPRTRCLSGLWRRDAGARAAAAPSTAAGAVLVRQLMTKSKVTQSIKASCDADVRISMVRRRPMTDRLPSAPLVHCARHIIHRPSPPRHRPIGPSPRRQKPTPGPWCSPCATAQVTKHP